MNRDDKPITYTFDSPEIRALCASDEKLAILIRRYGDLTYSLHTDVFTFFVETIIGQMLSNKAADSIAARLYAICGGRLSTEAVLRFDREILRGIGLSGRKAEYILQFAEMMRDVPDFFARLEDASDRAIIKCLTALHGIGTWSAKMYLIFVLGRLDVLPYEDGAFQQGYKWLYGTMDVKPAMIERKCESWRPYTSLAARYLYRALDEGLVRDVGLERQLREELA
ncbi:MAG: DNA-3-methyladenine glycosylase 2 family protein [Bacillota bacterium]